MTNCIPTNGPVNTVEGVCNGRQESTTRTSWMAHNAIPDSIIMNMICRNLEPSVEPNEPNNRSTEVGFNSKNTLRILNTIMPVVRAFTTMDVAKPVMLNMSPQKTVIRWPCSIFNAPSDAIQLARDDRLKTPSQIKIDLVLTYVCDC